MHGPAQAYLGLLDTELAQRHSAGKSQPGTPTLRTSGRLRPQPDETCAFGVMCAKELRSVRDGDTLCHVYDRLRRLVAFWGLCLTGACHDATAFCR